jgi:hypothetical protein
MSDTRGTAVCADPASAPRSAARADSSGLGEWDPPSAEGERNGDAPHPLGVGVEGRSPGTSIKRRPQRPISVRLALGQTQTGKSSVEAC